MRNQFFLLLIGGLLMISTGCKKDPQNKPNLKENLQKILDRHLANFKTRFPGKDIGFGLYAKSPDNSNSVKMLGNSGKVDVYVSSGLPKAYGESIQFRAASTTKSFTAGAILRLHQQGKLNIDDFITANIPGRNEPYIPATSGFAIPHKNKITIRLLLQHRAGVFDITNSDIPATANAPYAGQRYIDYIQDQQPNHTFTIPEMVNVVAVNQLSYFQPGEEFHYSNTGYHLLTLIIERVSGKRYDEFLKSEFLVPLQMNHTTFPYLGTDQVIPDPFVSGWLLMDNEIKKYDAENVSSIVGDGNIITTPADLVTWANALYGSNTILNPQLHAQMITGIPTKEAHVIYGLGTELNPPENGYGHNGAHPAYMTIMRYHPGTNTSYVLFCNFLDFDEFEAQGTDMGTNMIREAIQAVAASR